MPLYIYACCRCGDTEEAVHAVTEDPDFQCIRCGGYMKRRPQVFNARYVGQGFVANEKYAGHGDADRGIPPDLPVEFGGDLDTRK